VIYQINLIREVNLYVIVSDILGINSTQYKILSSIFEITNSRNIPRITEYIISGSSKHKIPKKFIIPRATFSEHIDQLERINAVKLVTEEKRQWKKKIHRKKNQYELTDLGYFYLIKYSRSKLGQLKKNNKKLKSFLWYTYDSLLLNGFNIVDFSNRYRELFDKDQESKKEILLNILFDSIDSINIENELHSPVTSKKSDIYREYTKIGFGQINVLLYRRFMLNKKTYDKQRIEMDQEYEDVKQFNIENRGKIIHYIHLKHNVIDRIIVVFFFNLLRTCLEFTYRLRMHGTLSLSEYDFDRASLSYASKMSVLLENFEKNYQDEFMKTFNLLRNERKYAQYIEIIDEILQNKKDYNGMILNLSKLKKNYTS